MQHRVCAEAQQVLIARLFTQVQRFEGRRHRLQLHSLYREDTQHAQLWQHRCAGSRGVNGCFGAASGAIQNLQVWEGGADGLQVFSGDAGDRGQRIG